MSNGSKRYTGSCLCGGVHYEFDVEPRGTAHCHCGMCRKVTGSAFATWSLVAKDHFRWVSGSELLIGFQSSEHGTRFFCSRCGSTLGNHNDRFPAFMVVATGTLDEAPELRVAHHVYVASKATWHSITDALPQHAELPPKRT